jgi:PmbA protein
MGYSYTEHLGEESIDFLLRDAAENASIIDAEDMEELFAGSPFYHTLESYSEGLQSLEPADKIAWARQLEEKALSLDPRIFSVQVQMGNSLGETLITNTRGLEVSSRSNYAAGYVNVVVKEGADTKNSYSFVSSRDFSKFNAEDLAREAVEESLSLLGAEPIQSGQYPILLRRDVASTFLATFSSSFSAEAVQKGLSTLKGKLGETIASPLITIIDDPHLDDRPSSSAFDDEGVATKAKNVVENGKLVTLLHNLKTARKDGVESTGNAFKASYNSPVSVAPSNFYIAAGDKSYDDLLKEMDTGLLIIALQGTHAGANAVSGDFSLSAYGYLVEGGKIVRPVNQITVAGNFFTMLSDVQSVGSDLKFGMGSTGAPSLLVSSLAVAGK